jgi:hypothetical protein
MGLSRVWVMTDMGCRGDCSTVRYGRIYFEYIQIYMNTSENTIRYEYNTIRGRAYSDIFEYSDPPEVPTSAIRNHPISRGSLANLSIFRKTFAYAPRRIKNRALLWTVHITTEHFSMDTSALHNATANLIPPLSEHDHAKKPPEMRRPNGAPRAVCQ